MVALVLPVGHYAGQLFTSPEAQGPESFEVRFRDGMFSLSAAEYAVWAVAHGDPRKIGRSGTSRTVVEKAAKEAGVEDPAPIFDSLVDDGLLVSVMPTGSSPRTFAQQHQIMPLALGLGNGPHGEEKPDADAFRYFQIGMPDAPRATVDYDIYHMWLFCHRAPTLWEALSTMAKEAQETNAEEQASERDDKVQLIADPDQLLSNFLQALPILVSTSCAYIDRRP